MVIPLVILKCAFLIPLLIIGSVTSYTDIKNGKIKNLHLSLTLLYILFLYLFLTIYSCLILHQLSNLRYLLELLINGAVTFFAGYLLWYFNLWAAGDVKLLSIYSLLVPLEYYSHNYVPYFPSMILLIDTFIFIFIFFIIKIWWNLTKLFLKRKISLLTFFTAIKNFFKNIKKNILKTGFLFLIISCLLVILQYLRIKINFIFLKFLFKPDFIYLSLFILIMLFYRTFSKNKIFNFIVILSGLFFSLVLIFTNKTFLLINTIKSSLILMVLWGLGFNLVHLYIENFEIKKIKVKDLHKGIFLAPRSLREIRNKIKEKDKADYLNIISSDGLSEFQIQTIRQLFDKEPEKEIYVYTTFPFAPFLFLSCIFTLLTKGPFLSFFFKL